MNETVNARAALAGKRIVVTRARHQAAVWEAVICEFGASPVAYPSIAIAPPIDGAEFDRCLLKLPDYDWLALSSGNAVRAVAGRARALAVLAQLQAHEDRGAGAVNGVGIRAADWEGGRLCPSRIQR